MYIMPKLQFWNSGQECPWPIYEDFKKLLNDASYHFADDSGQEWGRGYNLVDDAVDLVISNGYDYNAIKRMVSETKSLVDGDMFLRLVVKKLYEMLNLPVQQ
jgi:hypothetical protein